MEKGDEMFGNKDEGKNVTRLSWAVRVSKKGG